jgi:hypothetical protein
MEKDIAPKEPRGRKVRQRVGVKDRLMIINKDPGKVYRLVNADPARIYQMQQLGYEIEQISNHVPQGLRASLSTTTDNAIPVGGGQTQVLMSTPRELYEEGQQEKEQAVKEIEAGLKPKASEGQYGSIKIENKG